MLDETTTFGDTLPPFAAIVSCGTSSVAETPASIAPSGFFSTTVVADIDRQSDVERVGSVARSTIDAARVAADVARQRYVPGTSRWRVRHGIVSKFP